MLRASEALGQARSALSQARSVQTSFAGELHDPGDFRPDPDAEEVDQIRAHRAHNAQKAAFNAAYSDALAERTEAANNERAAQRELLQAIVHGQASDAEQRRAVARDAMTRYLERLRQVDQQRASNPLPETNCAR